ncbi:transposase [Cyclobacterium xiamenense]|uniref:transposase n=1 Tax=Cyclobacterium xiamenense TaxID=1297121 RepID=UPI0035CEA4D4
MKKSKFSEEQVIKILKLQEDGHKVEDICRKYGISSATFYSWRNKYSGMDVQELRRSQKPGGRKQSLEENSGQPKSGD